MTLSEFKAWFEGFSEGIDGAPTERQFEKIKAKVAEINGVALTREVVIERYRDWYKPYQPYPTHIWGGPYVTCSAGVGAQGGKAGNTVFAAFSASGAAPDRDRYSAGQNQTAELDIHAAMRAIGSAEAQAA